MKRLINYLKVKLNEERMFEQMYLKEGNEGIASLFTSNIKMLEESISILNGEIRESCKSVCGLGVNPYCSDRAKDSTCLHDGYCKHKQTDMERT